MNGYFAWQFNIYLYVVALPAELLSQVIICSSVGRAVGCLGQITLFEGCRPSEKRAKNWTLNDTLQ